MDDMQSAPRVSQISLNFQIGVTSKNQYLCKLLSILAPASTKPTQDTRTAPPLEISQVSILSEGKILTPPSGRKWATSQKTFVGRSKMNPRIRFLNNLLRGRMGGQRSKQFLILGCGKLFLKEDEPHFGQQYEDVGRKWEYYHIIIFPEGIIVN